MKRVKALFILLLTLSVLGSAAAAAHAAPYNGYHYSYQGGPTSAPYPYLPENVFDASGTVIGALKSPEDMYVTPDGDIYILDSGNNRIVHLNREFEVERVIGEFQNGGVTDTFNAPEGIFVHSDGSIYVADTANQRVVELAPNGSLKRIIGPPKSEIIRSDFLYQPSKVAVDRADRMYVVGKNIFDGLIEFDSVGEFQGFTGTNLVKFNPIDLLWKQLSTREQRSQMALFVPEQFNNLDIDANGFIYTTSNEVGDAETIKRLNPTGTDVLRREGYHPPVGDLQFAYTGSITGGSTFVAITVDKKGMFAVLDSKRGRIFTYDKDGNLLYQFGQIGDQVGTFRTPVALDMLGERMLVLDKRLGRITVFVPTDYGAAIREAVSAYYDGDFEESTAYWEQVLKMNANYDAAYVGMGKAKMSDGDSWEAMHYFKLGNSQENYSKAFERYRKEFLLSNFGNIMTALFVLAAAVFVYRYMRRNKPVIEHGIVRTPFYVLRRPFNGFWDMKYENQGRLGVALFLLALLTFVSILKKLYAGFIVNDTDIMLFNSLQEILYVVLPFVLWVVANWAVTTLMDGEGSFLDILKATAYATLPLIVIYVPQIVFSNIIIMEEATFYYFFDTVAAVWFVWLLFVGMMTVHQYSASKTIVTMLLTLLVIGIICFLGLLVFSLFQQIAVFFGTITQEIIFRL